jgi:lipopolysaccharide biosynthesis glycosyltransferase
MSKFTIYIGFDSREKEAYDVARHSILSRTTSDVRIIPIDLDGPTTFIIAKRPIERKEDGKLWCPISQAPMATEFAISRFCVPFLQHKGWALFCDCDILCLTDITEILKLADPKYAVMVVKHNHQPTETVKMDGQVQTTYSRKNWSSVILWNCEHPSNQNLTEEAINTWPGRDLHAFKWLKDEEIGELPLEWNFLVGVSEETYATVPGREKWPHIAHYTLGGPWFEGWKSKLYGWDDIWLKEKEATFGV